MARARGWPADLSHGAVRVRPLRAWDAHIWTEVRARNVEWLTPWESTFPNMPPSALGPATPTTYRSMCRTFRRQARLGLVLPLAVEYEGRFVGQVTVSSIVRGSLQSASVGYWVDQNYAGRGLIPTAVALVTDHCFGPVELHRVELNVRPENHRSRRVAEKLGFREEGLRLKYLHIDRAWRDHVCYALTVEDVPGGVLRRYVRQRMHQEQPGDTPSRLPADEQGGR